MSDNVAIKEGARAYNFTMDKLRTAQQNSDEPVIWVPESTVQLGSLRASDNGVYLAAAEDLYGYGEIVVSVNGAATIGDRAVFPDDSGQLHEENLPHDIVIFRPPKKLKYKDGEKINLGGIVVKAMDADANVWTNPRYPDGRIPLQELIIDPDHADISKSDSEYKENGVTAVKIICSDYRAGNYQGNCYYWPELLCSGPAGPTYPDRVIYCWVGRRTPGELYATRYNGIDFVAPVSDTVYIKTYVSWDAAGAQGMGHGISATPDPGKFIAVTTNEAIYTAPFPESEVDPRTVEFIDPEFVEGQQQITVTWRRYGDGLELSTTFSITVTTDDGFSGGSGNF